MYKVKLQILSILLIPVVLFSTMSFSIDKHICMDSVYSISLFGDAEGCGMETENPLEKTSNDCVIDDENCCDDESVVFMGSITDLVKSTPLKLVQTYFFTSFLLSRINLFTSNLDINNIYKYYSPPLIIKDISILLQIFRI